MQSSIPAFLREAAEEFQKAGAPLCLVGGWPRNNLLGLPPGDYDVSSALPPEQAAELFARVPGVRVIPRDTRLGTFGALGEGIQAEYTAFRTESYGPGGAHRPDEVRFGATMRDDALRRDFTVNALYYDIAGGETLDPLGGLPDLNTRLLRTCREPGVTFADDGLRLLRLVRFAAELGFGIEEQTRETARQNAQLLTDISPERIQAELNKILLADMRYPGMHDETSPVLSGLMLLDELRLLDRIAPEFAAGRGLKQRADYHDHDVLTHLLHTAACAPPVLTLRLAGLLHDIGKPEAVRQTGRMLGHDRLGEQMAVDILTRLRYPNAVIAEVSALVRRHMADLDGRTGETKLRLFFAGLGRELSWKLVEVRRADICGSRDERDTSDPAEKWVRLLRRMEEERVPWTERDLAVTGADLMALAGGPGEPLGLLKKMLHEHAILHPKDNTRERLLRVAARLAHDRQRFPLKGDNS